MRPSSLATFPDRTQAISPLFFSKSRTLGKIPEAETKTHAPPISTDFAKKKHCGSMLNMSTLHDTLIFLH